MCWKIPNKKTPRRVLTVVVENVSGGATGGVAGATVPAANEKWQDVHPSSGFAKYKIWQMIELNDMIFILNRYWVGIIEIIIPTPYKTGWLCELTKVT